MKRLVLLLCLATLFSKAPCQTLTREFLIESRYLNIPVERSQDRQKVIFSLGNDTLTHAVIRIADTKPDYWVWKDVSAYRGKQLRLIFNRKLDGIWQIYQADSFPGQDSLYSESLRPQFHFSTQRGWINDPNGLVWFDGEYHLFYQHNPYETQWENMHWGHAVSSDLIHWTELNDALYPDELGTMFSGSAVIDRNNTAGWGENTMIAAYTAHLGAREVQCIAYSHDKGRTFTKYQGNPVLGPQRDPKVIWYEPDQHWVMALYKHAGVSIFTSENLKEWVEQDHIKGFYECPELFELPVDDDPDQTLWVIYGGSGSYLLGDFNGKDFTPTYGKYRNTYGAHYAAQTFNNIPDGKRIQIGWGRIESPGMPFNQMMCFPTELSLRTTNEGIRLFSTPVDEIKKLHRKAHDLSHLNREQINEELKGVKHDLLHLTARIESLDGSQIGISYQGHKYCTMDSDELNRIQTPHQDPEHLVFDVEILIDRTSLEVYYQDGLMVFVEALKNPLTNEGLVIHGNTENIKIHKFKLYELEAIW